MPDLKKYRLYCKVFFNEKRFASFFSLDCVKLRNGKVNNGILFIEQ